MYNGLGQTTKLTAYNGSSSADQETVYLFEDDVNASLATSYDANTGTGTVLNEIKFTYDTTLGIITKSEQDHAGAVGGTEPNVQYAYDGSVTSGIYNDGLRLEKTTYPDGRMVYNDYGGDGDSTSLDDRLSRLQHLRETSSTGTILTEYAYNGTSRTVKVDYPEPDVRREMFSSGNDYDSWDRFGRTITHAWEDYTSTVTVRDQVDYTYDAAGNRLTRDVDGTTTYDHLRPDGCNSFTR